MKKAILVFTVMATGFLAQSQIVMAKKQPTITVGRVDDDRRVLHLQYTVEAPGDTSYVLVYLDGRYKQLKEYESVAFVSRTGQAEELYQAFRSLFDAHHKSGETQTADMTIGYQSVMCGVFRAGGQAHLLVMVKDSGQFVVTEKQLDRLFGK